MKIGWFTDTFLPQTNGVVTSLESFGEELVKRGNEIHVYCPRSDRKKYLGMQIHSLPSLTFRPYPEFKIGIPLGSRAVDLDVVHTHGPFSLGLFGLRVAKKQKIPKVSTFHTLLSEYVGYVSTHAQKILKTLTWKYCKIHYKEYDQLITPSHVIKNILIDKKIVDVPIEVIPTGIDTYFLKPVANAKKILKMENKRVFLCLGRVGHEKNLDVVIKAFKGLDSKLYIAGKGPALPKLKKLVRGLKMKNVKFLGYVPEKDKPLYYSAADAFIIASTSETQGIVVTEAMACRTPVIGTDSWAIPEMIEDKKNGFLFEPGNFEELSEIVDDFKTSKKMRNHALKTSREYSREICTDKLERFYKRL